MTTRGLTRAAGGESRGTGDPDAVLRADGVGFRYRSATERQLTDVSFQIRRGERVAVMGATGAGKTTLLMMFNGLIPHHHDGEMHGYLTAVGLDTVEHDVVDLVRHVGLVMQDPESQITGRLALDDAAVGPANLGLPRAEVLDRARRALDAVGLGELADRDTGQMSGGQQQRLAIAGILAMAPEILVLDEPTSELDPAGTAQVFAVVEQAAADRDRTVVLVEHEPELVAQWADRLIVLHDGALVHDGPPAEFFAAAERAEAVGLRPPQVTTVCHALQRAGRLPADRTAVTLDEAVAVLQDRLPVTARARTSAREPQPAVAAGAAVVIEATGLGHRYPSGVQALSDVDVRVREGEFVALLGRNGAGKTTFARHLNGLLRPTAGQLRVYGRPTGDRSVSDLATDVGYVFQNPDHQIFAPTVRDEVAFGLRNAGWAEDRIEEKVREVLDLVGMRAHLDHHPFRLGKGQRQRLAVASVLALEPRILIVDEPTTGQDWRGARAIMDLVRELNRAGRTILMVTHDMPLVAEYAHRALVFDAGRLRADLPVADLFADEELLAGTQLVAPQVTRLARRLGLPPVTTVEAFVELWEEA
ncbi:energy-coupling factor transporter ATPase [Micromonospora sp. NPDC052213]|uniref:ABC transporter ATP-binding protein n=1 Tax=Micromonospora sp. NPDC052213 TaxID=3155812 RepID=UPI003429CF1C